MDTEELPEAARVLARGFSADAFATRLWPDARQRLMALEALYVAVLGRGRRFGHVFGARDESALAGIAVWLPPGVRPISAAEVALLAARTLPRTPGALGAIRRFASAAAASPAATVRLGVGLRREALRLARRPAWYLWVLATDPDHRGRGHATRLIQRVLGRCDADGLPAFLETTDPANLRFYDRFGFEEVARVEGGPALPTVWLLSRSPDRDGC